MSSNPLVLAADIGGSTVKAALVARSGAIAAQVSLPSPSLDARSLIAPLGWSDAFRAAAALLKGENASAFAAVAAIAVTGVTRTPVVLDADGAALIGAMPARDARATEIAGRSAIDPRDGGEAARYDAFHPAARLQWIRAESPEAIARAAAVVDPKDFIAAQLTGHIASDPIASARLMAAADSTRGPSLLSRLGLPERLVPDLRTPGSIIGAVRDGIGEPLGALAGRPVVMASHDTWCGALGLGALTAGRAYNVS
ncbi:MAG TPA: FGGY family carbohydrate kinase, partial [Xanthobacteraceae bacterium]|nr:FGGY family carbohydrate kinase [Xanthobacteraceae bacterium]